MNTSLIRYCYCRLTLTLLYGIYLILIESTLSYLAKGWIQILRCGKYRSTARGSLSLSKIDDLFIIHSSHHKHLGLFARENDKDIVWHQHKCSHRNISFQLWLRWCGIRVLKRSIGRYSLAHSRSNSGGIKSWHGVEIIQVALLWQYRTYIHRWCYNMLDYQ